MKRAEAKTEFLELLRTDRKAARKCVKGKECGGRCIPQNWNCRLKGEGDTPPTRGGRVARTPETEAALKSFKKKQQNKAFTSGLKNLAVLAGGATAGVALASKGESASSVSKTASTAGGLITAFNPAMTMPVALAAAGASMGAYGFQARQKSLQAKATKVSIGRLTTIKKGIDTRIGKKENERKIYESDVDKANAVIQGLKTKTNKKGQYTDQEKRVAFAKLKVATNRLSVVDGQLTGLYSTSKRLGLEILQKNKGLPGRTSQIQQTMNIMRRGSEATRRTRSERLANRRNIGLTGSGKPGPKKNKTPWNLQSQNLDHRDDAASGRAGKKCGGSHISAAKKCLKGVGQAGDALKTVAALSGVAVLSAGAAAAVDDVVRVRSRQFGEPNFKQFTGSIGDVEKFQQAGGKQLAAGAFGSTKMVNLEGKNYVLKEPKQPDKKTRKAMAVGLDDKATKNLYRAQGRMTNSEVANTQMAASLGLAPKVVAANKNGMVSEVAKGKPAKKLNEAQAKELHNNLAKLHRAGIAHNDLKPDNFFVDKSNKIQFIDFGLSQKSATAVGREWYRAMNPESPNPLLKATGTATGSFNLRRFNEAGYKNAERSLRRVIGGDVTEERIIKAGQDPAVARRIQAVVNNYYAGRYNPRSRKDSDRTDSVVYRGETFSGYNKPKRTPNHPTKSHAVLAREKGRVKLIRFGQQGVKGSPKKKGESASYAARRRSFKARHAKNIAKGKMSAAYWANRSKW